VVHIARDSINIRPAALTGPDGDAVSRLLEAYLMQTEIEKLLHLGGTPAGDGLSERYRREVDNPARAYGNAVVYVAETDSPVGVVVVQQKATSSEIKRVWVDPGSRGRRVGSALIDVALSHATRPIRLTVWDWREDAVRLYRSRGFMPVESWDVRPRLLCMELRHDPSQSAR
jgi:ribosomal protein S18 acetylase RimI-like enzyme